MTIGKYTEKIKSHHSSGACSQKKKVVSSSWRQIFWRVVRTCFHSSLNLTSSEPAANGCYGRHQLTHVHDAEHNAAEKPEAPVEAPFQVLESEMERERQDKSSADGWAEEKKKFANSRMH